LLSTTTAVIHTMTYLKLIFLFILVLLDRCGIVTRTDRYVSSESQEVRTINASPIGTWRLNDADDGSKDSLASVKENYTPTETATIISFFPDSTFTEFKSDGGYVAAKWKPDSSGSSLTIIKEGKVVRYDTFFGNESNGLRIMTLINGENEPLAHSGFGKGLDVYKDDPFHSVNNNWRLKPKQPETKQEVLARLRGYVLHSALLLKAAHTRKQQLISWEFSHGIIKIYKSGIGLIPREAIPEIWIDSFHSREEALLAYAILEDFLITTKYDAQATGNWVVDDYNILINTYERLKTRNLASFKTISA
jgi:hypothetical protein